jgi:hypothetical protein
LGFDGNEGFGALDLSNDEKQVLVFNTNRRTEVTSLLVIRPFEANGAVLDYSFTSSDLLEGINHPNASSQIVDAKFLPNDTNVVYIVMKYYFLSSPDAAEQERHTGIYRFNQTDRTVSTIYTVVDFGTYLWFDFTSDPNRIIVQNKGLFSLDLTNNSTELISGYNRKAAPQDISNDGTKLLSIEYPDTLIVFDLITNTITNQVKAYTGQPHERLALSEAYWATDDYVMYSAGFVNPEPRAPFIPVILAVQSFDESESVSYELIHWPFRVGNVLINPNATSLLVNGEGYGEYDVFRLDLVRAIPEFPFPAIAVLVGISIIVVCYRFKGNVPTRRT